MNAYIRSEWEINMLHVYIVCYLYNYMMWILLCKLRAHGAYSFHIILELQICLTNRCTMVKIL